MCGDERGGHVNRVGESKAYLGLVGESPLSRSRIKIKILTIGKISSCRTYCMRLCFCLGSYIIVM